MFTVNGEQDHVKVDLPVLGIGLFFAVALVNMLV